jgi:DNA-binding NarL/FixJ family response regulator
MAAPQNLRIRSEDQELLESVRAGMRENSRLVAEVQTHHLQVRAEMEQLQTLVRAMVRRGPPSVAPSLQSLTPRELEVLRLVGQGKRTKEIAFLLGISFKTAVTHRAHIMEKLGIHEGPSLVRFAIRHGLCPP